MENEKKEVKDLTGLTTVANKKEAEYDLVTSLLKAADFRNGEASVTEVEIRRSGQYLFTIHITPIGDGDSRQARKSATRYMANPNGRKLPPIEKDFDTALFHSWLIYMATTEADRNKVWGNQTVMQKLEAVQPVEVIDKILTVGEKIALVDRIMEISGMDEESEVSEVDFAKNSSR